MKRFHITEAGDVKPCAAKVKACPLGGAHYSTPEAARANFEHSMDPNPDLIVIEPWEASQAPILLTNAFAFPEEVVLSYCEGNCWDLALQLHGKKNWPVYILTSQKEWDEKSRAEVYFEHMVVRNPASGKFVDVTGEHTPEAMLKAGWGSSLKNGGVWKEVTDDLAINQAKFPFSSPMSSDAVAEKILSQLNQ